MRHMAPKVLLPLNEHEQDVAVAALRHLAASMSKARRAERRALDALYLLEDRLRSDEVILAPDELELLRRALRDTAPDGPAQSAVRAKVEHAVGLLARRP